MNIKLNGRDHELESGTTMSGLLDSLKIDPRAVVVELNGDILRRSESEESKESGESANEDPALTDGDTIEIVHFVGGG